MGYYTLTHQFGPISKDLLYQPYADTGCNLEDLLGAMDDKVRESE